MPSRRTRLAAGLAAPAVLARPTTAQSLYSPANRDCVLPPDLAARLIYGPRVDSIKEASWAVLLPQRDAVLDRWNRGSGL